MTNSNGKFAHQDKKPGDLILSADWNKAMQEVVRLEDDKINRKGADTIQGSLKITEALQVNGNVTLGKGINTIQGSLAIAESLQVNGNVTLGRGRNTIQGSLAIAESLQVNGNVGIGTTTPTARLEVAGKTKTTELEAGSTQIGGFTGEDKDEWPKVAWYRDTPNNWDEGLIKHSSNKGFFKRAGFGIHIHSSKDWGIWSTDWTPLFGVEGGTGNTRIKGNLSVEGNIGIGTPNPRSALDTGIGVMTGAANDYQKAQYTLSGGGTVTWEGPGGRLKWTNRFIAISMGISKSFSEEKKYHEKFGYIDIGMPISDIPAAQVYDEAARKVDANGVVLNAWEALYAVHTVGGDNTQVSLQIVRHRRAFYAPSNWLLIAVVNGDDGTVKLGTGVIISAKSSSSKGSPLPCGTILMWSGRSDNIPDGWALCDGNNSTPDLRSRFIVGAGAGGNPPYNPGTFGEPDQHNHAVDVPAGTFSTNWSGEHSHSFPPEWYKRELDKGNFSGIDTGGLDVKHQATQNAGGHTHTVTVDYGVFNSGLSSGHNRPKWYSLCLIMKLF
ncbi:MAG: hypothetical protein AB1589_02645 [Cyanobacteriota bacterium]